jgi:hypothetical protein
MRVNRAERPKRGKKLDWYKWLVLVVSEVCARGYGAGRVREGNTRSEERVMGRWAGGSAMDLPERKSLTRHVDC